MNILLVVIARDNNVDERERVKDNITQFWTEHYQTGKGKVVCKMYGVCIDDSMGSDEFEYWIADNYIIETDLSI